MTSLKVSTTILFLLLGLSQTHAGVTRPGQCPQMQAINDFNLGDYLGVWYEIQRFDIPTQTSLDCVTAEYLLPDPSVARITVVNSGVVFSGLSSTPFVVRGVGVPSNPEDPRNPGMLSVAFFGAEPDPTTTNYWVIGTDYSSYSLVWNCDQITADTYDESVWVLSRTRTMLPESFARIYEIIAQNGIAMDDFRFTEQSDRCRSDLIPFKA